VLPFLIASSLWLVMRVAQLRAGPPVKRARPGRASPVPVPARAPVPPSHLPIAGGSAKLPS
jgi:hypothetical protein